jgi:hypothetical protein
MTLNGCLENARTAAMKVIFDTEGKIQSAGCRFIQGTDFKWYHQDIQ